MKFKFRLEQALRLTALEEKKKKHEIVKVSTTIKALKLKMEELNLNIRKLLTLTVGASPNLDWSVYQSTKILGDRDALVTAERNLGDLVALVEHKRHELVEILMKRKALERKKDTDRRQFRLLESRRDQKRMDDNFRLLSALQEKET